MRSQHQQLQISDFIKDPHSLKLLILAGTHIKPSEILTVAKCINLIKLDLSANQLTYVPIKFNQYNQLKILYLHDNLLQTLQCKCISLEYISLFDNPMHNYRSNLIQNNISLKAIDYNMVTNYEKMSAVVTPFTQIKWPLVEINKTLQSEEDYLNLLKAEVFVIGNLDNKMNKAQIIYQYIQQFHSLILYQAHLTRFNHQQSLKQQHILQAAQQWVKHTLRKRKLRHFLANRGKEHLLDNHMQARRNDRSQKTNKILNGYLAGLKQRMKARIKLENQMSAYRNSFLSQRLITSILKKTQTIYLKQSHIPFFDKICLYVKRLLFKEKNYDLCDAFHTVVYQSGQSYTLFRENITMPYPHSWILQSIHQTIPMVLTRKGIDRKYILYHKKGHKKLTVKPKHKIKYDISSIKAKCKLIDSKLDNKFNGYDQLVEYKVTNDQLFSRILKIIRYFNSGNAKKVLTNKTAYFQTEINYQFSLDMPSRPFIYIGIKKIVERVIAANIIQKWWRKQTTRRHSSINIIKVINVRRAQSLIRNWLSELIFHRRRIINKSLSYARSKWKDNQVYFHINIYMNMPKSTNYLRLSHIQQDLYSIMHKNTEVTIVQVLNRKWLRIKYFNAHQAFQANKSLFFSTYRYYYNGFALRLFKFYEITPQNLSTYQQQVKHLFGIEIQLISENMINKIHNIENACPYFIWPDLGDNTTINFETYHSLRLNLFVYNKLKRPLKINCDICWANPISIYRNKKKNSILVRSIKKLEQNKKQDKKIIYELPTIKLRQKRKSLADRSLRSTFRSKSIQQHNKTIQLLSQTLILNKM